MRRMMIGLFVATLAVSPMGANAATVSAQGGQVFINSGDRFEPVFGAVPAVPGAQLLLRNDAIAVVTYKNGCTVRLGGNRVWRIAAKAPCAPGKRLVDLTQPASYVGGHSEEPHEAHEPTRDVRRPAHPTTHGIPPQAFLAGGLVVAAGVGVAIAANKKPASP